MKMHIGDDRLHDYVDGLLGDEARAMVERHLAACSACSASVAELHALAREIAALPGGIAPGRDLRQGIHAAIDRDIVWPVRAPLRERSVWSARYALIAAGIVLVALSSAVTALVVRAGGGGGAAAAPGAPAAFAPDAFRRIEADYIAATAELEAVLTAHRSALAPETVRILVENLAMIDGALEEAGAALRADPGNVALSEMMVAAYEKKLDLLRRAAEDPTRRGGA